MGQEINFFRITGKSSDVESNTFVKFPYSQEWYAEDIAFIMDEVIRRYGTDEWRACILTNEIHRHIGIFSIIGVKMGILALELLGTNRDNLNVISFTGSHPPFSCLNDGIQVSTGATTGHGTIKVISDAKPTIKAVFQIQNLEVIIKLKEEYINKAESSISKGRAFLPVSHDLYWNNVRRYGLEYWLEWDRHKIFDYKKRNLS